MVLHVGAKPVFVDIDPEIYTMDPKAVQDVITPNTKALIPVHLYGHPADLDALRNLAEDRDICLIEDACQAHGALYKGAQVGSIGDLGCFSFYPSKNMTTGEGGMLTTNDNLIADKIRMILNHGEKEAYQTERLGHNFRLPEVSAAIGTVQIDKLPKFIEKRKENVQELTSAIKNNANLKLPLVKDWADHSWYLFTIQIQETTRDLVVKKLHAADIGASIYYQTPLHLIPYFKKLYKFKEGDFPHSENASATVVSLPVHPGLTAKQISYIGEKVNEILQ
jgi:dTDP-4-amino-4,6-dideoxygalactose transaminase